MNYSDELVGIEMNVGGSITDKMPDVAEDHRPHFMERLEHIVAKLTEYLRKPEVLNDSTQFGMVEALIRFCKEFSWDEYENVRVVDAMHMMTTQTGDIAPVLKLDKIFYIMIGGCIDRFDEATDIAERFIAIYKGFIGSMMRAMELFVESHLREISGAVEGDHFAHDSGVNASMGVAYEKIATYNKEHGVRIPFIQNMRSYIFEINSSLNIRLSQIGHLKSSAEKFMQQVLPMPLCIREKNNELDSLARIIERMPEIERDRALKDASDWSRIDKVCESAAHLKQAVSIAHNEIDYIKNHIIRTMKTNRVLYLVSTEEERLIAADAAEKEIFLQSWAYIHHKFSGEEREKILENFMIECEGITSDMGEVECINSRIGAILGAIETVDPNISLMSSDVIKRDIIGNKIPMWLKKYESRPEWPRYADVDGAHDEDADIIAFKEEIYTEMVKLVNDVEFSRYFNTITMQTLCEDIRAAL